MSPDPTVHIEGFSSQKYHKIYTCNTPYWYFACSFQLLVRLLTFDGLVQFESYYLFHGIDC